MKDVRVQIGFGLACFAVALIDQVHTGATRFEELTLVGKIPCILILALLAWFVVRYMIIGMFKK